MSDDQIFEILGAGSDREAAADLCAGKGVTVLMYCVWKAKYRHLTLEELREARRRELWRARFVLVVLLAAALLGSGGIVFGLARAAYANLAGLPPRATAVTALPHTQPATLERHDNGTSPLETPPARAPQAPRGESGSRSDAVPPPSEAGYKIQVAAAPTLQEGRVLLERLTSGGYPAYLSRAFVSNVEVFRVRVGPFDALPAAEEIAVRLKRDGYDGVWIAR